MQDKGDVMQIRRIRTGGRVHRYDGLPFQRVHHVSGPIKRGTVVVSMSYGRVHAWLGTVLRVRETDGKVTHVWTSDIWTRDCRAGKRWETRMGRHIARADVVDAIERHHAKRAYEMLPKYLQLRVDHVRRVYRRYSQEMGPLTLFGSICEAPGEGLPSGWYASKGTTAKAVSRLLADDFNRTLGEERGSS